MESRLTRGADDVDALELGRAIEEIVLSAPKLAEGPEGPCEALWRTTSAAAELIQAMFVDRMRELLEQQRTLTAQRLRTMQRLSLLQPFLRQRLQKALIRPFDEWQGLLERWLQEAIAERNKHFARLEEELTKALEQLDCPGIDGALDVYRDWPLAAEAGTRGQVAQPTVVAESAADRSRSRR